MPAESLLDEVASLVREAAGRPMHLTSRRIVQPVVLDERHTMYANRRVDDEFQPSEADAIIRHERQPERFFWVVDVHHDLGRRTRDVREIDTFDFVRQWAVVYASRWGSAT
jgi:hypothetical protein